MRTILCVVLLAIGPLTVAQCERLDSASRALEKIWDGRFGQEVYEQGDPFYSDFLKLLEDTSTFGCVLDSTAFIGDTWSSDGRLRVLSWDHLSTGSGHDMVSIAQFRDASGIVHSKVLCPASDENDIADVEFYRIHKLQDNENASYLLIGWGTHGGGSHHVVAIALRIRSEHLDQLDRVFPVFGEGYWSSDSMYVISTQRSHRIDMRYDEGARAISHNEFKPVEDEDVPWSRPTGRRTTLLWSGDRFIIKPE
ncbi:MAG: hypothetical protein IPJ76_13680 [Flavobacteriales bacterium]|nr:MAG: hypothetical protein IPJ76_13680 [Flavobacteriales bacterium]